MNQKQSILIVVLIIVTGLVLFGCATGDTASKFPAIKDDSVDLPKNVTVSFDDTITIDLVRISPGSFKMGCDRSIFDNILPAVSDSSASARPSFRATITKGYYIGKNNCTVRQFAEFLNTLEKSEREKYANMNPDFKFLQFENGDKITIITTNENALLAKPAVWRCSPEDLPVGTISWRGSAAFCEWVTKRSTLNFRLPTEAEWELAARGHANVYDSLWDWRGNESPIKYPGPGPTTPNGINGLATGYLGNWCSDYYGEFTSITKTDPKGPVVPKKPGDSRVLKRPLHSIYQRSAGYEADGGGVYGFRVVLDEDSVRRAIEKPDSLPDGISVRAGIDPKNDETKARAEER